MDYNNLIDKYLTDRMDDAERSAFESRLGSNPELKQEFNFHKDIVNSIREERKSQLKAMMDTVPVGSSSSGNTLGNSLKAVGTIAGLTAIITAAYFFTTNEEPAPVSTAETEEQISAPINTSEAEPTERSAESTEAVQDQELDVSQPIEEAPIEASDENSDESTTPQESKPAEIQAPNLVEDFENENASEEVNEPDAFTETEDFNTEELFKSNIEVIIDDSKKKFNFHYQLKNDKLFLFGTFDKGLYEILEFNNDQGQTIILYYKDNYYFINSSSQEIIPLKPIKDNALTEKLDKLRHG